LIFNYFFDNIIYLNGFKKKNIFLIFFDLLYTRSFFYKLLNIKFIKYFFVKKYLIIYNFNKNLRFKFRGKYIFKFEKKFKYFRNFYGKADRIPY